MRLGRLTAGPELAWRKDWSDGTFLELNTSIDAVWDYHAVGQISEAGLLVATDRDLRADARFGLTTGNRSGILLRAEAGFAGVGLRDFEATGFRLELVIPFGGKGGAPIGSAGGERASPMARTRTPCDAFAGSGLPDAGVWQGGTCLSLIHI